MPVMRLWTSAVAAAGKLFLLIAMRRTLEGVIGLVRLVRNRNALLAMREFDDAQLADIGLRRNDIERALHMPQGRDPFVHLVRVRQDPLRGRKTS